MAEIIQEQHERMLPEYEQMKKHQICSDEQIRECIKNREKYQIKLQQSNKCISNFAEYILYERKVHKWITTKERATGKRLNGLKAAIVTRICRLYRAALRSFPANERFWHNFIEYSKKSSPTDVSGIYEKMLTFHSDNPHIWCDAALWSLEFGLNMTRAYHIFLRGLQRLPTSEILNKGFFNIMLTKAASTDDRAVRDSALEKLRLIYNNILANITNFDFYLHLLEDCEEKEVKDVSMKMQKRIIDDLIALHPREEMVWNALAKRELNGFHIADMNKIKEIIIKSNGNKVLSDILKIYDTDDRDSNDENIEEPVWRARSMERRIHLYARAYKVAVETLETPKMWELYLDGMLELNQDMNIQPKLKRKVLGIAFQDAHKSKCMSIAYYRTYINLLLQTPNGIKKAEDVVAEALQFKNCPEMYEIWLSIQIYTQNTERVDEIFEKSEKELKESFFPIWEQTIRYYQPKSDKFLDKLFTLYEEGCKKTLPFFSSLRAQYLELYAKHKSLTATRQLYKKLYQYQPPVLDLHEKMAHLEKIEYKKTKTNRKYVDICYENAINFFGKSTTKLWINYIKFHLNNGDPKLVSILYERGKETLHPHFLRNFIAQHNTLTMKDDD